MASQKKKKKGRVLHWEQQDECRRQWRCCCFAALDSGRRPVARCLSWRMTEGQKEKGGVKDAGQRGSTAGTRTMHY